MEFDKERLHSSRGCSPRGVGGFAPRWPDRSMQTVMSVEPLGHPSRSPTSRSREGAASSALSNSPPHS